MMRNAAWTLSNLCRGKNPRPDFEQVRHCLPVLARLIYNTDADVLADACWTLSFLTDAPNNQIQVVVESGVCRRVVELLQHPSTNVVSAALRVVGNIVTGDDGQTQVSTIYYTSFLGHIQRFTQIFSLLNSSYFTI